MAEQSENDRALGRADSPKSQASPSRNGRVVVAIDLGTTYSGYAFTSRFTDCQDHKDIQMHEGEIHSFSDKEPTCVLFSPEGEFHTFGSEAENKYAELCDSDRKEASRWYFFNRFKMELHERKSLDRDLRLLDKTSRKSMLGLEVFSACIRHLKDSALAEVRKKVSLWDREVHWVLSVPAIWDDSAKQFMREAARMAGIEDDRLTLALEPECASVFCQRYFQSVQSSSTGPFLTSAGRRFMTVDCGGGTVDISAFEVKDDHRLRQLHKPEGAACGGVKVDDAFQVFFQDILGFENMAAIESKEVLFLMRKFEQSKSAFRASIKPAIQIPRSLIEMVDITLQNSKKQHALKLISDRVVLDKNTAHGFFSESKEGIVSRMKKVLQDPKVGRLDAILLVGGFSESAIIQQAIRHAFPEENILVPPSPSSTVMMGAVQYGHCPQVIATRVASFTYGFEAVRNFDHGFHDREKFFIMDGVEKCKDIFEIFIHAGDIVELDEELPYVRVAPVARGQKEMTLKLFTSTERDPKYITDPGCRQVGVLTVAMPDQTGGMARRVHLTLSVNGTELKVKARDGNTTKEFSASCDFLSH